VSKPKPNWAYLDQLCKRYAKASKKERGTILDEPVATCGYHRKHAIALLRGHRGWHDTRVPIRRLRRRIYGAENQRDVLWLAEMFEQIGRSSTPPGCTRCTACTSTTSCLLLSWSAKCAAAITSRRSSMIPKTPYQRSLNSEAVGDKSKGGLKAEQAKLDVVQLKEQIDTLLNDLSLAKCHRRSYGSIFS
jgi:hypothetical protein